MADYTKTTWAQALLQRLGFPTSNANVAAVVAWENAEGGHWKNTAAYNPLNTTEPMPGATSINSVGVKAYTSWSEGLDATVATLQNGLYAGVLTALKAGTSALAVAKAVAASPWGTGSGVERVLGYGAPSNDSTGAPGSAAAGAVNASWPGGGLDPLNWLSLLGNGIQKDVARITITGLIVLGGVALVVIGLYRAVQPTARKVVDVAKAGAA